MKREQLFLLTLLSLLHHLASFSQALRVYWNHALSQSTLSFPSTACFHPSSRLCVFFKAVTGIKLMVAKHMYILVVNFEIFQNEKTIFRMLVLGVVVCDFYSAED